MAVISLSLDNPVFSAFVTYAVLVIMKTMIMSFFTAYQRMTNKAFSNEEDVASFGKKLEVTRYHPGVERVRRCHQNDLENVIPFVLLGLLYVASGPSLGAALLHFRAFTVARFLHTLVYLNSVRQPARALCFLCGIVVNISMAVATLSKGTF
ncbi:hypothetical protein EGW08_016530 [Elysia chlorotica]|uniref:Microsomal glutathione S-transferase 1 n=1 Tax=Elysia chlorotica TaxID=188477 RepID=A0A3S0ZUQ8_ELYCH|nr:hypothetical protein EGW08_016530 [Elysia chlorotica]